MTVTFEEELDLLPLKAMIKNAKNLSRSEVDWGWLTPKNYRSKGKVTSYTIASIVFDNEYGKGKIPPRPYFTQSVDIFWKDNQDLVRKIMVNSLEGKSVSQDKGKIKNKMKQTFFSVVGTGTPLSPYTIRKKGHDTHWLETGQIYNNFSVKFKGF